jgi:hypothetical protein
MVAGLAGLAGLAIRDSPLAAISIAAPGRPSGGSGFAGIGLGIEQSVQMNDEIAHMGVVDRHLRLFLPRFIGLRIIGINADDIEMVEIVEPDFIEIDEFAAKNKMQKLLTGFSGISSIVRFSGVGCLIHCSSDP